MKKNIGRGMRVRAEAGFSLVELLIAMFIMVVGLLGIMALFVSAGLTNNKNARDTTSVMLSETVINEIAGKNANDNANINTLADCAGNVHIIANTPGPAPGGAGATLTAAASTFSNQADIDWTAAAPAGNYAMNYVACAQGGTTITYEVRWNVMSMPAGLTGAQYLKLVTVSARVAGAVSTAGKNILIFAPPATIRTIVGQTS